MGRPVSRNDSEKNRKRREQYARRKAAEAGTASSGSETAEEQTAGAAETRGIEGIEIRGLEENENLAPAFSGSVGGEPKPKPKKSTKKKPSIAFDHDTTVAMITGLIGTVSSIASARAGEHWMLSEEEARNIAAPTVSILERFDITSKLGNYADIIALGVAVGAAFIPRITYQMQLNKFNRQQKGVKEHAVSNVQTENASGGTKNTQAAPGARSHQPTDIQNATYGYDDAGTHVASIIGATA